MSFERTEKNSRPRGNPRTARRAEERARRERKRLFIRLGGLAAAILAVAVLAVVVYPLVADSNTATPAAVAQGRQMPDQGRDHIAVDQIHPEYNSSPPTSGWHYANWERWGVHTDPIPDGLQIHNLEHGGIMVQYNCSDGCPELVAQLKGVVDRYRTKVILAPYPDMDTRIALTAWTRIDQFEDFDEARIRAFIDTHINCGPEYIPEGMPRGTACIATPPPR
ncbi:MAG TPA: DUF3105 domain-containing protein [Chloroflexota bacterium]|nr:DUF3105 domain-containing protein [Chloroflexota bacterium]